MRRRPTGSQRTDTLFPYTTLFRSGWAAVFGLEVGPDGAALRLPDGRTVATGVPLTARCWYRIDATIDTAAATVRITQTPLDPVRLGLDRKSTRLNSSH